MKYLFFVLISLTIFSCDLDSSSDDILVGDNSKITLTSTNQEIENRESGGDPCIVKGNCSSMTCSAAIECGCDETPKCECSWSVCKCDCEKKGSAIIVDPKKYSVEIYQEYLNNLNSLKDLSNSSNYSENTQISPLIDGVLSSIENNDLDEYGANAEYLYDYVHSIQNEDAKAEINEWFTSRNISDEL